MHFAFVVKECGGSLA